MAAFQSQPTPVDPANFPRRGSLPYDPGSLGQRIQVEQGLPNLPPPSGLTELQTGTDLAAPPSTNPGFLEDFLAGVRGTPDWTQLHLSSKHIDERVVELVVEQFEDDLKTLISFIDVGDRPAFHLVPSSDEQVARWQDQGIRRKMIMDAIQTGGPKGVADLIDRMAKLEKNFWKRVLSAPAESSGA